MVHADQECGEQFVRLALAIDEHMPGYVDAYFGPEGWKGQAKQDGKVPLSALTDWTHQLAADISQANDLSPQRRDYLVRHITAMQMSLRLLGGEKVSLADEVEALYDVRPAWKDEANFEEAHRLLEEALPPGGSLKERALDWERSLEIPNEKVKELLPAIVQKLHALTNQKFDLPEGENFTVEFVSNQPWSAYNWYLGNFQSRIDFNTDLPTRIGSLPALMAHEGYPGHHTDLTIKEKFLVRNLKYHEFTLNLLNAPSAVMAEGIATTARKTILTDDELEEWLRVELLPSAGLSHIEPNRILAVSKAGDKLRGIAGNAAFMLHDQQKGEEEISQYLQEYNLSTEKEARHLISFISNPLYRSYIFTYHVGYDLLEELFQHGDRQMYCKRIMEEPVTPGLVRQWISASG
ncbi:MAG TPA: hypothetical protein VIR02_03790 [Anaerolineales bacterium]